MVELTVGVISAFIAAGIAILQFFLPNALSLVLVGNLSDSHSAVTWSVVSRFLLSSNWPLFLRSDSAASTAVARKIALVTWLKPVGFLLAAVAAVVTPLGLYDGILPGGDTEIVSFVYAADSGAIGIGTPPRSTLGFSRHCLGIICPGQPDLGNVTHMYYLNESYSSPIPQFIWNPEIPQFLVDLYQSGLDNQLPSMSGIFDVQYRQWNTTTEEYTIDDSPYLVPSSKMLTSLVLQNKFKVLEGVIANFKDGGIAFRNHSVPTGLQYGAEWEEELLWWEPEVQCVDTNISLTLTSLNSHSTSFQGLVDKGGFVNLNHTSPISEDEYAFPDGQKAPSIYERAYSAAWAANLALMQYLDITTPNTSLARISSELGQRFEVNLSTSTDVKDFTHLARARGISDIVHLPYGFEYGPDIYNPRIPNPHNITLEKVTFWGDYFKGAFGGEKVNTSLISAEIGTIMGPGYRVDGGDISDFTMPNTTWERSVFVCAAATKVSIKTFRFRYNTTVDRSLEGLYIVDVRDKEYEDEAQMPLWGLETLPPAYNLSSVNPLWGLIDDSMANSPNLSTIRSKHFYIPAGHEGLRGGGIPTTSFPVDNVPGTVAPPMLWSETFTSTFSMDTDKFDYSGTNDLPLSRKWQKLAQSATDVAKIPRLIWTDYATNFLTGTKGLHTPRYRQPGPADDITKRLPTARSTTEGQFPVHVLRQRIRYQWVYAIPAAICISVVGAAVLLALFSMICGHGTVARLRFFLFNLSCGRLLASFVYPDHVQDREADTKHWIETVGHKPVQIIGQSSGGAKATGVDYQDQASGSENSTAKYVQVRQREEQESLSPPRS